jgi:hypothetical protein
VRGYLHAFDKTIGIELPSEGVIFEELVSAVLKVLDFRLENHRSICESLANQQYADVLQRCMAALLTGDINHVLDTHLPGSGPGRAIALSILAAQGKPDLLGMLKQSIASGLMGIDQKGWTTGTLSTFLNPGISIGSQSSFSENLTSASQALSEVSKRSLAIDFWAEYRAEVLEPLQEFSLVVLLDDYIESIFDLAFIQEELRYQPRLSIQVVPKPRPCGVDITVADVEDLLTEPLFADLSGFRRCGRFDIFRYGPTTGTIDGRRISAEFAALLQESDGIFVKGARSFETLQGIRKPAYYAFVVAGGFSESVTGLNREESPLVFVRAAPGVRCFENFRARSYRTSTLPSGRTIGLAEVTTLEYAQKLQEMRGDSPLDQ